MKVFSCQQEPTLLMFSIVTPLLIVSWEFIAFLMSVFVIWERELKVKAKGGHAGTQTTIAFLLNKS